MVSLLTFVLTFFPLWAKTYESEGQKFTVETLVSTRDVIWGFDFLPEGKLLFTQRSGKMFTFDPKSKKLMEVKGLPKVYAVGQGGLLDVRVDPDFSKNKQIFFTFAEPLEGDKSTIAVGRARLEGSELKGYKKIFSAHYAVTENRQFGSRIEFDGKGNLFVSIGEFGTRDPVWNLDNHLGKLLRISPDGKAAPGNPDFKDKKTRPEIYAFGLRSPQGLAIHPKSGELWASDMGPHGGDEINVLEAGKNYGWPRVTKGKEYWGASIGVKSLEGVEEPVIFWEKTLSPSGMDFYSGEKFPKWKNNLFVANLAGHLRRIVIEGRKVIKEEVMLKDLNSRFRSVREGADGLIYFSTDEGKIYRINPI